EFAISANGRNVAFNLAEEGGSSVFVRDLDAKLTERVSIGRDGLPIDAALDSYPQLSEDGRFVTFAARGDALIPEELRSYSYVYLRDRHMHTTELVSVSNDGTARLYA